jgi:glycosyltransferase involved in cell wall biosynthesis
MSKSLVSLIVTTKNEAEVIERLLKSIKKQSYKIIELIVVDNNSTDKTAVIVKKYTKHIFSKGPERSTQRNFGAKKAKGDYFMFLDADMELSPHVVEECVDKITQDKKVGAVTVPEQSKVKLFWEKVKAHERSFYNEVGDTTTDASRFFSRKAFLSVGGYDESITGPEDWDLPENVLKKGYKTTRIKSVIYHYERVPSLFQLGKKKYYYALTSHRYLKKHNISPMSAKTIYFLRPVFYKNWRKLLGHPVLSGGMFVMFAVELASGGFGFLVGRIKNL